MKLKNRSVALALCLGWMAHAQPSAPTGLFAAPGDGQAVLTWQKASDSAITGYAVRHATDEAAFAGATPPQWAAIAASGATTTRHTVPALANGTRYYFQIRATSAGGDGPPSNTATTRLAHFPGAAVSIGDANLRRWLETAMEKTPGATITQLDMAALAHFSAWNAGILDAAGLEHAVNLTSLDLSNNRIADVTALGRLTALDDLTLDDNIVSDVTALGQLTALTRLRLSNNRVADIAPLARLTLLEELRLGNNRISDATALGALTALRDLHIGDNRISDAAWLLRLTRLRELTLDGNNVSDLTALRGMSALRQLWANGNAVADVTALGGLTTLEGLHLDNNNISDVTPLGRLLRLAELSLVGNSISNVTPLGTLTKLQGLHLDNNAIADVAALGTLSDLFELSLRHNNIADVQALGGLRKLGQLWLSGNDVADVAPLGRLTSLRVLELDSNGISDLASFASLAPLRELRLHLNDNAIADVTALGRLPGVRFLYLNGNNITDVTALADASDLFWLELDDNKIANVAALGGLPSLTYLSLDNNAVSDVTGLAASKTLVSLRLRNNDVSDLASFANLTLANEGWPQTTLDLGDNNIADAAVIGAMTSLEELRLDGNQLTDVTPLGGLAALGVLDLGGNNIADVAPLGRLTLFELVLENNRIADISALGGIATLRTLDLRDNDIADVTALAGLPSLRGLRLDGNRVADAGPLVGNHGAGIVVGLRRNPLSQASIQRHLPALRAAGAAVLAGRLVPLFPAAADASGRQGFVRVLNRSDVDGDVWIDAVDDAGVRAGPVRLTVGAGAAAHFNSEDLEDGSATKGLAAGTGPPTAGAWRLALLSTLDIEVLAYARTPDGFLTSIHDVLPRAKRTDALRAAVFNPARNRAQRSSLRLVNAGAATALMAVRAVDDRGAARAARLAVPTGAVTVAAEDLEGHRGGASGLGRGVGKWRLAVDGQWSVEAMSLLTSPGGHMTNLSTAPAAAADGVWRVPLFPAASNAYQREGFVRIANHGAAGEVVVSAVDDGGVRVGPLTLPLDARQTTHFNSGDLERGNAAKGLPVGVGAPTQGDWRLEITSAADIRVTSFVRTAGGFLTSMHDVVPAAGNNHHVFFFNPASNPYQVSMLRLVNNGPAAATATVTGVDDAANQSGEARATVPAGHAVTFTAAQLEEGDDGLSGSLGDGEGKWRLRIASDQPLRVMSLLASPGGHLTNLSSGGADP